MSEYLKCPLCGAPLDQESESDNTINMTCNKCGYTGPSIYKYSHWDVVAIQEEQNAIIAAALGRARKGGSMSSYLPAYGMTSAELEKLNTRVCEVAGGAVERCPVNFYQDAITALENTGARWVIRRNKDGYSVKVWTRGRGSHPLLCVAICRAIAGKGKHLDCDTQTIRDADGRVVHRAGNDRTYMPGDDLPEM